jgi:hypothetical protein
MLKKDSWILGIALGVLVPVLVYVIIYFSVRYLGSFNESFHFSLVKQSTLQLAGIFVNMFTFRYYMVNLKYDKTGRGILLATFIFAGLFVFMHVL